MGLRLYLLGQEENNTGIFEKAHAMVYSFVLFIVSRTGTVQRFYLPGALVKDQGPFQLRGQCCD